MPNFKIYRGSDQSTHKHHWTPQRLEGELSAQLGILGLGPNRALKSVHQASSGPAPRSSMKRKAAPMLVQTTPRSVQA